MVAVFTKIIILTYLVSTNHDLLFGTIFLPLKNVPMIDLKCKEKHVMLAFSSSQRHEHISNGIILDLSFLRYKTIKVKVAFERGLGNVMRELDAVIQLSSKSRIGLKQL